MAIFLPSDGWPSITAEFTSDDWQTVDLASASPPPGAVGAVLSFFSLGSASNDVRCGTTPFGSTSTSSYISRLYATGDKDINPGFIQHFVKMNGTEIRAKGYADPAVMDVYVSAWLESDDMVWFDDFVPGEGSVVGTPVDDQFATFDFSPLITPGDTPAAMLVRLGTAGGSSAQTFFCRPLGSPAVVGGSMDLTSFDVLIPIDTDGKCEILTSKFSGLILNVHGYTGQRYVPLGSPDDTVDTWPVTNGDWSVYTSSAEASATGIQVGAYGTASQSWHNVRTTGADFTFLPNTGRFRMFAVGLDGSNQFEATSRYGGTAFSFGAFTASQSTPLTITLVNGNDTITSGAGSISASGTALDTVTEAAITGGAVDVPLTISSQSETQIYFNGFSFYDSPLGFGKTYALELTDGTTTVSRNFTTLAPNTDLYVDVASVDNTLLGKDIAGLAIGHQLAHPKSIGGSTITLFDDGDVHYDPALLDNNNLGTTFTRRHWDTTAWDAGLMTVYQVDPNAPPPTGKVPEWVGSFELPSGLLGQAMAVNVNLYVRDGDEPITYTELLGNLSNYNLALTSTGTLGGVPNNVAAVPVQFRATNQWGYADTDIKMLNISAVGIYNPVHQSVSINGAEIAVTTPYDGTPPNLGYVASSFTMYWVADLKADKPTRDQIYVGRNADGTTAKFSGSVAVSSTGQIDWQSIQGTLAPDSNYTYWFAQKLYNYQVVDPQVAEAIAAALRARTKLFK